MAEECADCGGSFASPAELMEHIKRKHGELKPKETLAMNPESERAGLVCALCGVRLRDKEALARHNVSPHYRTNRPLPPTPTYFSF